MSDGLDSTSTVPIPVWQNIREQRCTASDVLNAANVNDAPIDAFHIAKVLGVPAIEHQTTAWVVAVNLRIEQPSPYARVWLRGNMSRQRTRFALAYGLARVVIGTPGRFADNEFRGDLYTWALDLVVPQRLFKAYADWLHWDMKAVARIRFGNRRRAWASWPSIKRVVILE